MISFHQKEPLARKNIDVQQVRCEKRNKMLRQSYHHLIKVRSPLHDMSIFDTIALFCPLTTTVLAGMAPLRAPSIQFAQCTLILRNRLCVFNENSRKNAFSRRERIEVGCFRFMHCTCRCFVSKR